MSTPINPLVAALIAKGGMGGAPGQAPGMPPVPLNENPHAGAGASSEIQGTPLFKPTGGKTRAAGSTGPNEEKKAAIQRRMKK